MLSQEELEDLKKRVGVIVPCPHIENRKALVMYVKVLDYRDTAFGRIGEFLVTPVSGEGKCWITVKNITFI